MTAPVAVAKHRHRDDHAAMRLLRPFVLAAASLAGGCASVPFDLAEVPFPVSASPAKDPAAGQEFEIRASYTMWVHGLLGENKPDVAAELIKTCNPCAAVTDFRVEVTTGLHEWLATHLSLGLVRLKTVTIRGRSHALPAPR